MTNDEIHNPLNRQKSITDQIVEIINERIISEIYPSGSKLPPGDQLAKEFNVSRATIRIALSRLEGRKLVQRRQGVGTYVREYNKILNPLNEFYEFSHLIRATGYQPDNSTQSKIIEPDEELLDSLKLKPGSLVLEQKKVYTADGDPFAYLVNYIPVWVFEEKISLEEALKPDLTDEFINFFKITCGQKVSHFVSTLKADIYENIDPPSELINNGPNTPVLVINETGFNEDDNIFVYSSEFLPGNWMTFKVIRHLGNAM
jgi:DNA-binding GntR family transcriptional regulator